MTIKAILKRPGEFGRATSISYEEEDEGAAIASTLGSKRPYAECVGEIEVLDVTFLFLKDCQSPDLMAYLAPAFYHGFSTIVMYEGKMMSIKDLRGPVLIVGSADDQGHFQDVPARLFMHAIDIV